MPEVGSKRNSYIRENVTHSGAWCKLFTAIIASQWCNILFDPRFCLHQLQEMDGWIDGKSSQLDLRGTGTKNVKWWLDDKGECNESFLILA